MGWCVWVAVGLVVLGGVLNGVYLFNGCPIELSGDEAHYWEWSRHLDYGYYSKPPGIAWVIGGAVKVGGWLGLLGNGSGAALAPVMRMAAVVFGILSGLLSLFLVRRIFRDDRVALAVIAVSAAVPMFAVGSLLITIDSPMYLCWAGTVCCLWRAVEGSEKPVASSQEPVANSGKVEIGSRVGRGIGWLYAAGVWAGVGMMFKPVLVAVPVCVAVAAWADRRGGVIRRAFGTWHSMGAFLVMMSSQVPVVVWNARHGWVTFRHILTQGGLGSQAGTAATRGIVQKVLLDPVSRIGEYVGGQAGGMGGIMFVLLVIAVIVAWRRVRGEEESMTMGNTLKRELRTDMLNGGDLPLDKNNDLSPPVKHGIRTRWTAYVFLLSFTVPLWGFYFVMNFWKGTEVNWPAASYFAGMILLAGIFAEGWNAVEVKVRRAWRVWGMVAIVWGVLMTAVAMNTHRAYPWVGAKLAPLAGTADYFTSWWNPRRWDRPIVDKLRGMQSRADEVEKVRREMLAETGQEPLIITGRYDDSSSLAFYMPGQPFVYCIMSSVGGRMNQYDLWPGLNEKGADGGLKYAGGMAVIVGIDRGAVESVVKQAFEKVVGPERYPVSFDGVVLREVTIYRAYGFKGMPVGKGGVY